MRYYYFHGYGSSPNAEKADNMREILGKENVSAPDFNLPPKEIRKLFNNLEKEIKARSDDTLIVGSSMGGLFAAYISAKTNCRAILLNPCLFPMLMAPKLENASASELAQAQTLSLYAFRHYNPDKISVWVTNDELINHDELTFPFFHKGLHQYKRCRDDEGCGHNFIGFKNLFRKYTANNG